MLAVEAARRQPGPLVPGLGVFGPDLFVARHPAEREGPRRRWLRPFPPRPPLFLAGRWRCFGRCSHLCGPVWPHPESSRRRFVLAMPRLGCPPRAAGLLARLHGPSPLGLAALPRHVGPQAHCAVPARPIPGLRWQHPVGPRPLLGRPSRRRVASRRPRGLVRRLSPPRAPRSFFAAQPLGRPQPPLWIVPSRLWLSQPTPGLAPPPPGLPPQLPERAKLRPFRSGRFRPFAWRRPFVLRRARPYFERHRAPPRHWRAEVQPRSPALPVLPPSWRCVPPCETRAMPVGDG